MVDILSGMVITSIIISMVFYLFVSINKQVAEYGQIHAQLNSFLLLKTDLHRQFDQENTQVNGIPMGFVCQSIHQKITYQQEGNLLLRKVAKTTDTMVHDLKEMTLEFVKDQNGNLTNEVRELSLKMGIGDRELAAHIYRASSPIIEINESMKNEF
jgi:uncharacterized protein (DUF3084 family)